MATNPTPIRVISHGDSPIPPHGKTTASPSPHFLFNRTTSFLVGRIVRVHSTNNLTNTRVTLTSGPPSLSSHICSPTANKVDMVTEDGVGMASLTRHHLAATDEGASKLLTRLTAPGDSDKIYHNSHPTHSRPLDPKNTGPRLMYSTPLRHL